MRRWLSDPGISVSGSSRECVSHDYDNKAIAVFKVGTLVCKEDET